VPVRPPDGEVTGATMSKKKTAEYRNMSPEELASTLKDVQKHLFDLRFQSATDRLETPSEIRKARRDIARIKTVQRLKEVQAPRQQ
jgi:large subunit ribosomal protein L29